MMNPSPVPTLGKLVHVGGSAVYIRRLTALGLFELTLELAHDERATGQFFVQNGQVLMMVCEAALLVRFGGGAQGREGLRLALQAALKLPAPKVETVSTPAPVATVASPELAEWREARAAWLERRNLENARRFNRATAALAARR